MPRNIAGVSKAFASDERGTVVILFAFVLIVVTFIAGIGLDYGRMLHTRDKLAAAADAASLAAGRALLDGRLSDSEIEAVALKYFNENFDASSTFGKIGKVTVTLNRDAGTVRFDVDAAVPMTLTRVAGYSSTTLPVHSASAFDDRDIEVALALDVTTSMGQPASKISDLRSAAKDLVDILLPDGGTRNRVRIALAPYAAGVNAGWYASTATGGASNGCVHERSGANAFTDVSPARGTYLGYTPGMSCPSAAVVPLSADKDLLKSSIDSYRANGYTAGHIGTAWAWYLLSSRWSGIWPRSSAPAAEGDGKTLKAVVLMTDGEFNTQYVRANGTSSEQALSLCGNMKDKDVVVYAVGFMSPPTAEAMLRQCASSADHYFSAANGTELRSAFQAIAMSLNNLRLTQ